MVVADQRPFSVTAVAEKIEVFLKEIVAFLVHVAGGARDGTIVRVLLCGMGRQGKGKEQTEYGAGKHAPRSHSTSQLSGETNLCRMNRLRQRILLVYEYVKGPSPCQSPQQGRCRDWSGTDN
jgi:hypothetical protein